MIPTLLDTPIDEFSKRLRSRVLIYVEVLLLIYLVGCTAFMLFGLLFIYDEIARTLSTGDLAHIFGFLMGMMLFIGPFFLVPYHVIQWRKATKHYLKKKDPLLLEQLGRRRWAIGSGLLLMFWAWITYEAIQPLRYGTSSAAIVVLILVLPLGPVQFGFMYRSFWIRKKVLAAHSLLQSLHNARPESHT